MHRRDSLRLLLLGTAGLGLGACSGGTAPAPDQDSVLEVARANALTQFLQAVDRAGLTETLSGIGPFTVFAPSNAAFRKARLPNDPAALQKLMRYHIVPGMFTTEFLGGHDINYTTLAATRTASNSLDVNGAGNGLTVNGARVLASDLMASNGVVYIIDAVLALR